MPRVPTIRPSESISGAAANASMTAPPSARWSQHLRRRTGAVTRNGLKVSLLMPLISSRSAGWSNSVDVDQPSTGSGMTNTRWPAASVS
jgi:hypothetical protein